LIIEKLMNNFRFISICYAVAPQKPKLEHEGQHILPGNNITVDNGATATVKCVSHYGNPPAVLKWFLGDQEIAPLHPQANSTEPDNPRTWSAASVVQVPATKERHGMPLKCLAFHEYYSARTVGVEARMDVRCKSLFSFRIMLVIFSGLGLQMSMSMCLYVPVFRMNILSMRKTLL
jgi:CD80-like C2-set immunoglobulin domain